MRDGWIETSLGEVAEWWSGGTPKAREPKYYENGTIPWAVIADMNKGVIDSTNSCITEEALDLIGGRLAPVGSVLISMYASVGKSAIANVPLATNQAIAWSIPNQEKIMPFFLYLVSQQLEKTISDLARGATQRNINRQMLREFTFLLPPLPEQKRIVDLISSVDSYIEALQQQLEKAKKSRNAVLHELLTAGSQDWIASSLGAQMSLEYGKPLTESNRDGVGFPVYGSAGIVGMHSKPLVTTSPVIVVGRKGTAGAVYWSEDRCFIIDTAYFVETRTDIELKFLFHLLNFVDLKSVTAQTGVPGLNRDRAYSLKCKIPPKAKQIEIVEIISIMDEVLNKTELALAGIRNLRSGILTDLLSGEHEIPASYDKAMGAA